MVIKRIFSLGLALGYAVLQSVSAFGTESHKMLTYYAFNQELDKLAKLWGCNDSKENWIQKIKDASVRPDEDKDENDGGSYSGHFYSPEYDVDTINSDKAFKRMVERFVVSIKYAEAGDKDNAIEYLGRSLHYLQDMCCPVHMWGYEFNGNKIVDLFKGNLPLHFILETRWDTMCENAVDLPDLNSTFEGLKIEDLEKEDSEEIEQKILINLGEFAHKFSYGVFGEWIKDCHNLMEENLVARLNKFNPLSAIIRNAYNTYNIFQTTHVNTIDENSVRDILFWPAYVASHSLVRLFVKIIESKSESECISGDCTSVNYHYDYTQMYKSK